MCFMLGYAAQRTRVMYLLSHMRLAIVASGRYVVNALEPPLVLDATNAVFFASPRTQKRWYFAANFAPELPSSLQRFIA